MAPVHREREDKFEVPEDAEMPDLDGLDGVARVEGPRTHELEATYFDTPQLDLAAAGITLRRRTGGGDAGWHLKIPTGDGSRDELQLPLGRAVRTVPKPLREAVQLHTRGRRLGAVAQVRTSRSVRRLYDVADRALVEVSDDRVTASALPSTDGSPATDGGRSEAWREWEVELTDGRLRHLRATGKLLERAGATPADTTSKLARTLGERLPERAQAADGPGRPDGSAAAVVHARLREQVAELRHRDPLVRRDAPDAVHKMRVALRRLRSALATFRPLLETEQTEPLREEMKWLAGVLGEARDAEVMRGRLDDRISEEPRDLGVGPVRRRVDRALGAGYRTAHQRSVEAMGSQRYFTLMDDLAALVAAPPWTPAAASKVDRVLPDRLARDYRRLRRRVAAADEAPDPGTRAERLHEVRKAAKRARYTAETLAPAYGADAERLAKKAQRVQSVLGDHHDAVVTQDLLRRLADDAHRADESAFTYGRLHAREQALAGELEAEFEKAWARLSAKKTRRRFRDIGRGG